MSAELVDPFATHEPGITPDEWVAIRDEVQATPWLDPARFPELVTEALKVLGDLGLSGDPQTRRTATQCLRRMLYRATTGGWPGEREAEPADSLDPEDRDLRDLRARGD